MEDVETTVNAKDKMLDEIDEELRAIDVRLKEVLSKTDDLLKEFKEEPEADNQDSEEQPE